jgi:hypothetical protein
VGVEIGTAKFLLLPEKSMSVQERHNNSIGKNKSKWQGGKFIEHK